MAGFNSIRFDVPMLAEEFLRKGVDFDTDILKFMAVKIIFHCMEDRIFQSVYEFSCNRQLENAHSAEADVIATYEVLKSQLDRYPDLQNNVDYLSKEYSSFNNNVDLAGRIIFNDAGVEVFNFGKHRGRSVSEVLKNEPSYYTWMMDGDFPLNTKQVLTKIRLREING